MKHAKTLRLFCILVLRHVARHNVVLLATKSGT